MFKMILQLISFSRKYSQNKGVSAVCTLYTVQSENYIYENKLQNCFWLLVRSLYSIQVGSIQEIKNAKQSRDTASLKNISAKNVYKII